MEQEVSYCKFPWLECPFEYWIESESGARLIEFYFQQTKMIFKRLYCIYVDGCRYNFTPRQNTYTNHGFADMYTHGSCLKRMVSFIHLYWIYVAVCSVILLYAQRLYTNQYWSTGIFIILIHEDDGRQDETSIDFTSWYTVHLLHVVQVWLACKVYNQSIVSPLHMRQANLACVIDPAHQIPC